MRERGYPERIQEVIDYIEVHLDDNLTLGELAQLACFSEYHFHRVFQLITGDTVMTYIRKRRLAKAAYAIAHSDARLLDIAITYGFSTQETFIRAFRKLFGTNPSDYRKRQVDAPIYPKVNVLDRRFNPYLGGIQMDFQIVRKPQFDVIGYQLTVNCKDGSNNREIPKFWQQYMQQGLGNVLYELTGNRDEYGICQEIDMETGDFNYVIGVEVSDDVELPEGTIRRTIPAAEYAVFTTPKVPDEQFTASIQNTWGAIFSEWFPHSGYEHAGAPEFEFYDIRSAGDENGLKQMDIYLPVVKKQG